jgi:hypothetical protein
LGDLERMSMGNLTEKANQLETAIQETAFEGIQDRREYSVGMRLIEIAQDVARISDALAEVEDTAALVEPEVSAALVE